MSIWFDNVQLFNFSPFGKVVENVSNELKTKYNSIKKEEAVRSCILRCWRRYRENLAYERSINDNYQKQLCATAVVTLQKFSWMMGAKRNYKKKMLYFKRSTIRIQTGCRGFIARAKAADKMALYRNTAASYLQVCIRRYLRWMHLIHRRLKLSRSTCIVQSWWRIVAVKLCTNKLECATTASISSCETSMGIIVPIVLVNTVDSPRMEARACTLIDNCRQINLDRCITTLENKWRASWIRKTHRASLVVRRAIVRFWLLGNARKQFILLQKYKHKSCLACQCTVRVLFAKACTNRLRRARKDMLFRRAQVEFASVNIYQDDHEDTMSYLSIIPRTRLFRQRIIQASCVVDCSSTGSTTTTRNYAHNRILATAKPPPPWAIIRR